MKQIFLKNRVWIVLIIVLALLPSVSSLAKRQSQQKEVTKQEQSTSRPVHVSVQLAANKTQLDVTKRGGHQSFSLDIPQGFDLTLTDETESNRYLIFTYQFEVFDGGSANLMIIDKSTLKLIQRIPLKSFNISKPLIDGDTFYVAASGLIAKVRLSTGEILWKRTGLQGNPYYFDGIFPGQNIEKQGERILFGPDIIFDERLQRIELRAPQQ